MAAMLPRKAVLCLVAVAIFNMVGLISINAAGNTYVVRADSIGCVIKNADRYLESAKDPIIIWLDLCPITEPSAQDLSRLVENTLPSITVHAATEPKRILVLRHEQVRCLMMNKESLITPHSASQSELVALDLSKCK